MYIVQYIKGGFVLFVCLCAQVRTLFVSGLPMDAKPRELYLLFRAYDGYENSQLKVTSKNGKMTSVRTCSRDSRHHLSISLFIVVGRGHVRLG